MIAVDTNILVYAHRRDGEWHEAALRRLRSLAEGQARWTIPWPCIHEFLVIVTHPRIYSPPTPLATAFAAIEVWLGCPTCTVIAEGPGYLERLRGLVVCARAAGGLINTPESPPCVCTTASRSCGVRTATSRAFRSFRSPTLCSRLGSPRPAILARGEDVHSLQNHCSVRVG